MKQGWTYKKLGDIAEIIHGKNQKDVISEEGQYPIYGSGGNIMGYARDYLCEANTTILGRKGSINNPQFITERFWNVDTAFGIFAKNGNDSKFIYYFIKSIDWSKKNTGTTLPSLTQQVVKSVELSVPSLAEQERIVEQLDAAFAQIDELKNNAERQLAEARALFQSALTQAMQPKPGWQEKTLGDITTSMADGPFGSNLKKEHYTDIPEVRIIQLSNIGEDGWREENTKYTTFNHLQTIQRSEVLPGDIVIAKMMPAGRAILCPSHETKFVLSSDAVRATLKDGLNRRFVLYSINSPYFRKQVYENVSGSGRVRTSLTKLRACKLFIPNKDVQDKVVKLLDSLSENIRLLEELHHKTAVECDALKQALLRQIFE